MLHCDSPSRPIDAGTEALESLIATDTDLAVLTRMQLRAIHAVTADHWREGVTIPDAQTPEVPLLQSAVIRLNRSRLQNLLCDLAMDLATHSHPTGPIREAIQRGDVNAIELVYVAITYDQQRLGQIAEELGQQAESIGAVAQIGALPVLLACGQKLQPKIDGLTWSAGSCPVCGAWPSLAEMRGLDREHWLRCGRCGCQWRHQSGQCVFCGEQDHEQLGYLASEEQRESRRAVTCEQCRGYLKTFATLGPLSAAEMLARDAGSLELDVAALEANYQRPSIAGFRIDLQVDAIESGKSWLGSRA